MAFYSGQATSYQEILTVLVSACQNHGWSWNLNTLSKNGKSIQLTIERTTETAGTPGPGILLKIANDAYRPRFGLKRLNQGAITWPMDYKIFIFDNPDEVYLVAKYSVDYFLWMGFGVSNLAEIVGLNGTGMWCGAHSSERAHNSSSWGVNTGFSPSVDSADTDYTSAMLFGGYTGAAKNWSIDLSLSASMYVSSVNAIQYSIPNYERSLNVWSQNLNFIPIIVYVTISSSKVCCLAEIQNSRYVRLNNYDPEQIVSLGNDKWMIFPWWKKTVTATGEGNTSNTGTMGWAIRYEGP